MIAVFRFLDLETFIGKLAQLGIPTRPAVDEEGNIVPLESRVGAVMNAHNPPDVRGHRTATVRLTPEQAALIPDVTSPEFLCDWREDEAEIATVDSEQVEQPLPWPEYEIPGEDGTYWLGAGGISG